LLTIAEKVIKKRQIKILSNFTNHVDCLLAAIFDMIPIEDRLLRAEAFSLATTAIAEVIRRSQAKHHGTAGSGTPAV
jgi:hypothetical protein